MVLSRHSPGGTDENRKKKNSVKTSGLVAENLTQDLPNTE
jgi:hypothetical protein